MKKPDSQLLFENLREFNSSVMRPSSAGVPGFGQWGNVSDEEIEPEPLFGDPEDQDVRPEHSALYMKEEDSVFDLDQPYIKAGLDEDDHKPLFQKTKHPPYYEPALQDDFIAEVKKQLNEKIRSKTFRMKDFINAESQISYANAHLKKLGCGSSRCVYLLTPKTVLKVARDDLQGKRVRGGFEAGLAQNEAEFDVSSGVMSDVVAKVLKKSNTFEWIVSELVHQFKELKSDDSWGSASQIEDPDTGEVTEKVYPGIPIDRFEDFVGLDISTFSEIMGEMEYQDVDPTEAIARYLIESDHLDFEWDWGNIEQQDDDEFYEDYGFTKKEAVEQVFAEVEKDFPRAIELLKGIRELSVDFGVDPRDFEMRPEHFGVAPDGRVVVLDYGFDESAKQFYREQKEINDLRDQLTNEPFQVSMRKNHPRWKKRLIGMGGNKTSVYPERPSMKRSKSAPPNAAGN